jgi:hypothetical protein
MERARAARRAVTALVGLVAVGAVLASAAGANVTLLQLSSDPFTNTGSQHATEVEPDTLAFGNRIVSAFQVGRFFGGGASDIGFATSSDNGTSWTNGFLPGTTAESTPPGSYAAASDASVAFDAKHNVWLISYLGAFPGGNGAEVDVLVSRSIDGGLTWSSPIVVNASGHFDDKNWTACDNRPTSPFYGNCYTEFDDNTLGDLIQMSTSSDGGLTWGAALSTANGAHGIGGQPLVQPTGRVIVPIVGFAGRTFTMVSFTSSDGGTSWSKTNVIARVGFHEAAGGIRDSIPLPSAETDAAGNVYVVWQDCHFEPTCNASDLVLTTSGDGKSWSKLTRIPLDPRGSDVDHFIPGLAVDPTTSGSAAHLVVTYYYYPDAGCTTATCQLDVGAASSTDGGATWSAPTQLAGPMTLTWLPDTSQGFMVGDYISTSFSGAAAFPAFAVASAPTAGGSDCETATPNCNQPTFTVTGGIAATGATIAATDKTSASTNVTLTTSSRTAQ